MVSENLCSSDFSVIHELGNALTIHVGPSTHKTSVSGDTWHGKFQLKQLKPGKIINNQKQGPCNGNCYTALAIGPLSSSQPESDLICQLCEH